MPKLGQIFDELAKLGKSIQDTHNRGGWLICKSFGKMGSPKVLLPTLMTLVHKLSLILISVIYKRQWKMGYEIYKPWLIMDSMYFWPIWNSYLSFQAKKIVSCLYVIQVFSAVSKMFKKSILSFVLPMKTVRNCF